MFLVGSPMPKLCLLLWFVSAPGWSSGGNIAASWFVVPGLACFFHQMVASLLLASDWSAQFGFVLHQRLCCCSLGHLIRLRVFGFLDGFPACRMLCVYSS